MHSFMLSQLGLQFLILLFSLLRKADHILLNKIIVQLSNSMKTLCNCQDASEMLYEQNQEDKFSQVGFLPLDYGLRYISCPCHIAGFAHK